MTETSEKIVKKESKSVGPGMGLIIIGISYLVWWMMPFALEAYRGDERWAHNWAYAIIILTVGLAWYHESAISRIIATVQAFMLPVTASGSFNTHLMTFITIIIFIIWLFVVLIEKAKSKMFLIDKLEKRTWMWINMHTVIVAWILIAHMSLVFLIGRVPLEDQLLGFGTYAGYLANLPPEKLEFATWTFDITLLIWAVIVLYEQFKMGYNVQKKPWPKWSFYWVFVIIAASLIALLIQSLTIGFQT